MIISMLQEKEYRICNKKGQWGKYEIPQAYKLSLPEAIITTFFPFPHLVYFLCYLLKKGLNSEIYWDFKCHKSESAKIGIQSLCTNANISFMRRKLPNYHFLVL